MALLERDAHLAELRARQAMAASGRGQLVFLGGEAGIGKTSLLTAFVSQLPSRTPAVTITCDGPGMADPLAPLFDLGDSLGPEVPALLARGAPRGDIFRAVLRGLRGPGPARVLVVEDVHWADEATLELLRFLGRRIDSTSALVVAAYRDDEISAPHPLHRVLGDLANSPAVSRLELPRLSQNAVETLIAGSQWDAGELHKLTGGNPFFVTEVVAAGTHGVPASVRDAVLARASRLSLEARAVLDAAAVSGSPIDADLLARVIGGDVVESLDECLAAGMLVPMGATLGFRHAISTEAILTAMSPLRRRALHRRVLEALLTTPGGEADPAQLAHHADLAGDRQATYTWAVAAARRAEAFGAHREAAAQYGRALRAGTDLPLSTRMDLMEARSYECYLTGDLRTAIEVRAEVVRLATDAGDLRRQGDSTRWLSRFCWFSGDTAAAQQHALDAHSLLARLPPGREFTMALSNLAQLAMLRHRHQEAIDWGDQAIGLATRLGATDVLVHALVNVGTARYLRGEDEGRSDLERAVSLGERSGLEDDTVRGLTNLAWCALMQRDLPRAQRYVDEGIGYAEARDLVAMELYQRAARAGMLASGAQWSRAEAEARALAASPAAIVATRIVALTCIGRVQAVIRGNPWTALDEAWTLALTTGELQRLGPVCAARAEAAWLEGRLVGSIVDDLVRTHALAVTLNDPWQAGELALWLHRAGRRAPLDLAAAPYADEIAGRWAAAVEEWEVRGYPLEASRARASSGMPEQLMLALAECDRMGALADAARITRELRALGVRHIPRGPRPVSRANPAGLTPRELEVLRLVDAGASDRDIADRLVIAPKTVGHHVSSILAKLQVSSRTGAAERARELGVLQTGEAGAPR